MAILLTYTLRGASASKELEVKSLLMKSLGYADNLYDGERVEYRLPDFSLWKTGNDIHEAGKEFAEVCQSVGADYKSYFAVNYDRSAFDNR